MSKLEKCVFIVNLLRQKVKLSLKEINDYYTKIYYGEDSFSRRSFLRYKEYIEDHLPYSIQYDSSTKSYYLCDNNLKYGDDPKLYEYIVSLFNSEIALKLLIKHRSRIRNTEIVTGTENLLFVLHAIDASLGLQCLYSSFINTTEKNLTLIPMFLTTWEGRWYLIAETPSHPGKSATYALERMKNVTLTKHALKPSVDISVNDYFNGCYGIQHEDINKPIEIIFRVKGPEIDYLRVKPIHETQTEELQDGEWVVFKIKVALCYNLYQEFLWHRESLEVLEPKSVRDELRRILIQISNNYGTI